jgi:hypothetical protein
MYVHCKASGFKCSTVARLIKIDDAIFSNILEEIK